MFNSRLMNIVIILCGFFVLFCFNSATARQTVVIGKLGIGYDHWERTYDDKDTSGAPITEDEGDRQDYAAWPDIEIQSNGIHDTLSLRYAPVLRYDNIDDKTDVDQYLYLNGEWLPNRDWNIGISNDFVLSNDPDRYGTTFYSSGDTGSEETPVDQSPVDEISSNLGRTRYWTNNLIFNTSYTYREDSEAGIGYAYRVLRDDSENSQLGGGYDDYDRHDFSGLWSYRFNSSWKTQLDLNYIKGIYEDRQAADPIDINLPEIPANLSQDLQEYRADLLLDYNKDVNNRFPLLYRFRGTQYEDLRQDIWVHEVSAGWEHDFDSRTRIIIGAGPSYVNSENLDGEWGYNAFFNFTKTYQHWDVRALINKRYDPRNFTGSNDSGLTDLTDVRIDLTYRFTQDLSAALFGQYRYEDILNPQGEYFVSAVGDSGSLEQQNVGDLSYSRDSISTGASLDYTFLRWFVATVRYVYFQQDGDLSQDSYTDHRITFLLTASKDLWR